MAELKNGEFGVDMKEEKILWTDRKRHTIFALPISFTKYTLMRFSSIGFETWH